MRLSWNEIRTRAAAFAREWADATYEKGETQSFYNEFFEIFGKRRRDVARYEQHVKRLDNTSGFIDLLWPGVLLVEQKSAGRDLKAAADQAGKYFDALHERIRPRYQLLCDFQTFELLDRDEREEARFALAELPQHVEKFGSHRTFAWGSDARGKAHVHVVIIGLDAADHAPADRRLFAYEDINGEPLEGRHAVITPYLFDGGALADPHVVVREEGRPINGMPRLKTGVQMIDNGILTFTLDEYHDFVANEPGAQKFFRKYIGGDEYINGFHRWMLYLADSSPSDLRHLPRVRERIQRVREYRASSRRPSTVAMSAYPTRVGVDERLSAPFLVLPNTSSERRLYIPIGWLTPEVVANQKLRILPDATLTDFALLTSAMHMAWMRAVTGRMKSDYMYSVGVVYNTFPLPPHFADADTSALGPLAQTVLDARDAHADATLADLYDPDLMPPNLRRAHHALDRAVDRLYRRKRFTSERERIEYLFEQYDRMQAPLAAAAAASLKRRHRRRA